MCPAAPGPGSFQLTVMSVGDTSVADTWRDGRGAGAGWEGEDPQPVSTATTSTETRAGLARLLVPEADIAPLDRDRPLAAGGPVGAELVVEAAAGAARGVL